MNKNVMNPERKYSYMLSVLVEDESGVLSRISGLFARRGFNIKSLVVGPSQKPENFSNHHGFTRR